VSAVGQLTEDDLKTMTAEQIAQAYEAGRLNTLLGRRLPGTATGPQLTHDKLKGMSAHEIVAAQNAGQLDDYLGRNLGHGPPTSAEAGRP
jgi:hypothetical protein